MDHIPAFHYLFDILGHGNLANLGGYDHRQCCLIVEECGRLQCYPNFLKYFLHQWNQVILPLMLVSEMMKSNTILYSLVVLHI